jgi:hypothetical protein
MDESEFTRFQKPVQDAIVPAYPESEPATRLLAANELLTRSAQ